MRRAAVIATLALLLSTAFPAAAESPVDIERSKASFRAGANAYAAGDYLAAIQALEKAYELAPLPAIAFSLAQAERKQYFVTLERQHLERALQLFRRYLEQEPRGARREDALSAIAMLEPLLASKATSTEAPPKSQARPTRLMIVSDVAGARISLDDQMASTSPLIREVTPGTHHARVEADGYFGVERDVTAIQGELLLTEVQLTERPGSLRLRAPDGADVYVDGVYVAQGGPLLELSLPTGRHQLVVGAKGRRLERRDVDIGRGQAHTEVVTLAPTVQRVVSEYLFIGGGATLGAGIVLSAFAIRSENRAEAILADWSRRGLQKAELVSYNATLVERNRYRTAAAVGVAASLGMFITGLFLHELDHPAAPPAARKAAPEPPAGDSLGSLELLPAASSADVGASLQVQF